MDDRYAAGRVCSGRCRARGSREIAGQVGKQGLEIAIRSARYRLLYLQSRLLVDARAGQRGLGKPGGNCRPESGQRTVGNLNKARRERRVGSCQVPRHGLDGVSVRIRVGN
jgi:repressor of nif and glnA expression